MICVTKKRQRNTRNFEDNVLAAAGENDRWNDCSLSARLGGVVIAAIVFLIMKRKATPMMDPANESAVITRALFTLVYNSACNRGAGRRRQLFSVGAADNVCEPVAPPDRQAPKCSRASVRSIDHGSQSRGDSSPRKQPGSSSTKESILPLAHFVEGERLNVRCGFGGMLAVAASGCAGSDPMICATRKQQRNMCNFEEIAFGLRHPPRPAVQNIF